MDEKSLSLLFPVGGGGGGRVGGGGQWLQMTGTLGINGPLLCIFIIKTKIMRYLYFLI